MYMLLVQKYYELLLAVIELIPDSPKFMVPDDVYSGITSIFSFVGWLMPYDLYEPLFVFILGLTAFRIAWAFFITFRKR